MTKMESKKVPDGCESPDEGQSAVVLSDRRKRGRPKVDESKRKIRKIVVRFCHSDHLAIWKEAASQGLPPSVFCERRVLGLRHRRIVAAELRAAWLDLHPLHIGLDELLSVLIRVAESRDPSVFMHSIQQMQRDVQLLMGVLATIRLQLLGVDP